MNKILLIGRLTKAPELRYTQSGTAVASFTLAVNRSFANQNGEREADFINCVAWQKAAEFVSQYFKKGQQMALEGRLQVRSYDDNNGQRRWVTEVVTEKVEFVGSKGSGNSGSDSAGSGSGGSNIGSGGADSPSQLGWGEEIVFDDNDIPF